MCSLSALLLTFASPALASDETELPDDILGGDLPEKSVRDETRQLVDEEAAVELPDEKEKKRVIQTFQRKNFMKSDSTVGSAERAVEEAIFQPENAPQQPAYAVS